MPRRFISKEFFVLDLSIENLPPGERLQIGEAIIEISEKPHTGCKKFAERFGVDALAFISTPQGAQRMRGVNARVRGGMIQVGDRITRLGTDE